MKRILFTLFLVVISAAAGALGCWFYFAETMKSALALGQDMFSSGLYSYEFDEADRQYTNPNRDVAIYALSRAVKNLEQFPPPQNMGCRHIAFGMAKLNIRLAHLHKEAGDKAAEDFRLQSAISHYAKMGWRLTDITELQKALPLIEAEKTVEAMKSIGRIEGSCE
jgi:hypothetical protein